MIKSIDKKGIKKNIPLDKYNSVQQVRVFISPDVLAEFFIKSGRAFMVEKGMPMDVKMVRFESDTDNKQFVATFEHPSFDRVLISDPIPIKTVTYTAYKFMSEDQDAVAVSEKTKH